MIDHIAVKCQTTKTSLPTFFLLVICIRLRYRFVYIHAHTTKRRPLKKAIHKKTSDYTIHFDNHFDNEYSKIYIATQKTKFQNIRRNPDKIYFSIDDENFPFIVSR